MVVAGALCRIVGYGAKSVLGVADQGAGAVGLHAGCGEAPQCLRGGGLWPAAKLGDEVSGRIVFERVRVRGPSRGREPSSAAVAVADCGVVAAPSRQLLIQFGEQALVVGNGPVQVPSLLPAEALCGQVLASVEELHGVPAAQDLRGNVILVVDAGWC